MARVHRFFLLRSSLSLRLRVLLAQPIGQLRLTIPSGTFSLRKLTDDDCISKFRFDRAAILRLAKCLRLPRIIITKERAKCSGVEGLCIVLRRLAVPDRWSDLIELFARSRSAMCHIFHFVIEHLVETFADVLFLDVDRLAPQLACFASAVVAKGAEVENVWAFIDGTVRACARPSKGLQQRSVYNGHKRKHALKFQTLVTPDGMIAHIFGPLEGRYHDITLLRRSQLEGRLKRDARFNGYVVFGDPAYGRTSHFTSPFRRAKLTPAQKVVNKSMSRVRVSVEWSYGEVIKYWSHLDLKAKMRIGSSPIGQVYKVAVLLTNCMTCIYQAGKHQQ
jgi:hypothetical protein